MFRWSQTADRSITTRSPSDEFAQLRFRRRARVGRIQNQRQSGVGGKMHRLVVDGNGADGLVVKTFGPVCVLEQIPIGPRAGELRRRLRQFGDDLGEGGIGWVSAP